MAQWRDNTVDTDPGGVGRSDGRKLNIVVEGCCHGELPIIYASVLKMQQRQGIKVDLLICCGDFQCLRNTQDFRGLACPDKYKRLGDFHRYYSGELVAPVLTLFIGGNHEASAYLQELHYGGWVAPKIYFMGFAGVIRVGGVRIAGLTGIFNGRHYKEGRYERPPYTPDTLRSVYHVRELEVFKLAQLTGHVDVCLSHDWPRGIAQHGNMNALFRKKAFLKPEVEDNSLGSPAAEKLLHKIQPDFWFSAHLHVKFAAVVRHAAPREGQGRPGAEMTGVTRFLSLDKCLPKRDFLQLVSVPRPDGEGGEGSEVLVEYDVEWLSIVKASHHLISTFRGRVEMPFETPRVEASQMEAIRDALAARGLPGGPMVVPDNFEMTAPTESQLTPQEQGRSPKLLPNPQTDELLSLLGVDHVLTVPCSNWEPFRDGSAEAAGGDEAGNGDQGWDEHTGFPFEIDVVGARHDPNEIELDD
ncbi:unnamed protein product [Ascophyllum nodosum]